MKGFLIGAERSGSGKTAVATGIIRSLRRRGLVVAPYKCGPDYIDTLHLSHAAGRPAHNLDSVLLNKSSLKEVYSLGASGADICVAEGAMGLFDGISPEGFAGSSYDIALKLGLPVVLVINAASVSYSVAGVVNGFQSLAKGVRIAGVVLNNVASANHERLLTQALDVHCSVPVTGCVPRQNQLLESRHLGIKTALEVHDTYMESCADIADKYIDMEFLQSLQAEDVLPDDVVYPMPDKICMVAYDKAFNFYYEANFHALRKRGYEIRLFSPVAGEGFADADLLYIGGGYPELYANELSAQTQTLADIREYCADGGRVIAECGGMMLLTKGIHTSDGFYEMTGYFDAECRMAERRQALGYVLASADGVQMYAGHEFHYSYIDKCNELHFFNLEKLTTGDMKYDGFCKGNVFAGYTHFHFMSEPSVLELILG